MSSDRDGSSDDGRAGNGRVEDEGADNRRPGAGRRARGSLESEILDVLSRAGGRLTPAQVRAELSGTARLSYSAVVTTLTRLYAKGMVTRRRDGRAYLYAVGDPAAFAARRMTRLLDDQADHRVALAHFLAALSPGDEALLRSLIAEAGEPDGSDGFDGTGGTGGTAETDGADGRDRSRGPGSDA